MKKDDQIIYQKIGELLWSVMPNEAKEIKYVGMFYENSSQAGTSWVDKLDTTHSFYEGFNNPVQEIEQEVRNLAVDLQKCSIFSENPWTHLLITLTENGNFKIDFAYISEEDSWPSLYMRSVSDLDQTELDEYYIPMKEWERCVSSKK